MSLDKAIASDKERRRPYRRSARFDPAFRHQGGSTPCPFCRGNRTYQGRKALESAKDRQND